MYFSECIFILMTVYLCVCKYECVCVCVCNSWHTARWDVTYKQLKSHVFFIFQKFQFLLIHTDIHFHSHSHAYTSSFSLIHWYKWWAQRENSGWNVKSATGSKLEMFYKWIEVTWQENQRCLRWWIMLWLDRSVAAEDRNPLGALSVDFHPWMKSAEEH